MTISSGTYYLIAVIDPVDSLGAIDHSDSTVVDAAQMEPAASQFARPAP